MIDNPQKPLTLFFASVIGSVASEWLSSTLKHARVLAVVTHCIYLVDSEERLVWLANEKAPLHPRSIRLIGNLPRLKSGIPFWIEDRELVFQAGFRVNTANAKDWHPFEFSGTRVLGFQEIYKKYREVYAFLAGQQPRGFGTFIAPILASTEQDGISSQLEFSDPVLRSAWPLVHVIVRTAACRDWSGVLNRMKDLVGLGSGLTPSGDDFLGGLFFGWYLLTRNFPQLNFLEAGNLLDRIEAYRPATNLISFTLLKDNALGHAPDPLTRFGITLLTDQSIDRTVLEASELTILGHSTGWDMLTGFLVGMLLTFVE